MMIHFDSQLSDSCKKNWEDFLAQVPNVLKSTGHLFIETNQELKAKDFDYWLERALKRKTSRMVRYQRDQDCYQNLGITYSNQNDCSGEKELPIISVGTKPCLLLDRDGVINVDDQYISKKEDLQWMPGIFESLKEVAAKGIELVVLTNQSGIGRGYYTEDDVLKLHKWMQEELASKGITLKHWYYCPYHPQAVTDHYKKDSPLRKPRSAMAEMAFADLDLDPRRCVMVGDKISDQLDHLDISTFFIKGKYDIPEDDKLIKNIGVSLFGY